MWRRQLTAFLFYANLLCLCPGHSRSTTLGAFLVIRKLSQEDLSRVEVIYRRAFAGFPWFETLTHDEVMKRLVPLFAKPGFTGLLGVEEASIGPFGMAVHWHDFTTVSNIQAERGTELAQWIMDRFPRDQFLIWERELIVDPLYQRMGHATALRRAFLEQLKSYQTPCLVLTRIREDNIGSIKSAEAIGMKDTGVTVPASQKPLLHHYWSLQVG